MLLAPFKIGDICQTVDKQWLYEFNPDGQYKIDTNNNFKKQIFLLLDYPVLFKSSKLEIGVLTNSNLTCFGIKILTIGKIRYLFFENNNLLKHIERIC